MEKVSGPLCPRAVSEIILILNSRDKCKHGVCTADAPCRFRHGAEDVPLVAESCGTSLTSPKAYNKQHGEKPLPRKGLEQSLFAASYARLGPEGFQVACTHQTAALRHFATREGARMVCQGLPQPDELQSFAMNRVREIWGNVITMAKCQEYLDRSSEHTTSKITGGEYSAPSRRPVKNYDGPQGTINIARIVKVGLANPNVDFKKKRDTAWHGCQARSLDQWKPDKPNTHPQFRLDKFKHTAHGAGIYVTPAFEHAVGYAFRMWNKSPRFAVMHTKSGERWNYCTIMQLAIYDRGVKGVVDCQRKTWGGLPSDGWDDQGLEWVVRDASKAQIYGLLFCFFPDDPPQGG